MVYALHKPSTPTPPPGATVIIKRGRFCGAFTPLGLVDHLPAFVGGPENPATTEELRERQAPVIADLAPQLFEALNSGELEARAAVAQERPGFFNGPKVSGTSFRLNPAGALTARQIVSDYAHVVAARKMASAHVPETIRAKLMKELSAVATVESEAGSFYPGAAAMSHTGSYNNLPIVKKRDGGLAVVLAVKATGQHMAGKLGMFGGMADPGDIIDGRWQMATPDRSAGTGPREMIEETSRTIRRLVSAHFGSQPDMQNTVIGVEWTGITFDRFYDLVRESKEGLTEHKKLVVADLRDIPALVASPFDMPPWLSSGLLLLCNTIDRAPELAAYRTQATKEVGEIMATERSASTYWATVRNESRVKSLVSQMAGVQLLEGADVGSHVGSFGS